MLALAGIPLGFSFSFVAETPEEDTRCVRQLGTVVRRRAGQSPGELYDELGKPEVLTAEKEQIECSLLHAMQHYCTVHPNPGSFATLQDRLEEKRLLDELGIPTAAYLHGETAAASAEQLSLPVVVKSCRGGYDGKNQWVLRSPQAVATFDSSAHRDRQIIEKWVPFDREVSIVSVRDANGDIGHYPMSENVHEEGILWYSIAPVPDFSEDMLTTAQGYISKVMHALEYVGVMAIEFFVTGKELLVNEIAPRVHNSGHWTQSGSKTSQFENHLRAITGLPLGSTENHSVSGMMNLIGTGVPPREALSSLSTLHWYDKAARPGRKLGHVNFVGRSHEELTHQMDAFRQSVVIDRPDR
jgi:5-(carboxyamino)imidazole ribonucleotide synthase